ncbi:hypothetical protein N018_18830 [Pseudomonas syringae CC1557]|uniref:Uncharacterized protein n=1 Tax=Pseudomonas syringae CC1557 TaxID=1357279 RepID=W0N2E2_PSESX|nr:hypothetical protein N018_18830 [Pseudomonas syringae CC1557]
MTYAIWDPYAVHEDFSEAAEMLLHGFDSDLGITQDI